MRETQLLGSIQRTLYWDQNTRMPSASAAWRGEQLSLLAKYLHVRQSSSQFEELLNKAKIEFEQAFGSDEMDSIELLSKSKNLELLDKTDSAD